MDDIVSVKPYNNIKAEYPSTVLEIKMYERIRGGCLNSALKSALKRYPYFTYKFIEREGNFFWTEDCDNFTVTQTDKLRKLGTASAGYHFVDVTYSGCCIRIAFYHGVCDARGIIPFARTLIWRYCCQRYNRQFASGDIRLPDSKLLEGETDDPYSDFYDAGEFSYPYIEGECFTIPALKQNRKFRTNITLGEKDLLALCKKYNSTPAVMIALLSSRAIKSVYSDAIKPIVCCVSVDRRKALNRKNTFRNCIGGAMLSYNGDTEKLSLENQSDVLKKQLELQKDENYIKSRVNSYIEKFKNSDNKTEYVVRREYSSFFANKNFSTFLLSYPGKIDFGECNKSVAAVSLYTSGIKGLSINMIAAADKFFIDIVSDFETQDIVMALIREFAVNGLACSAGDLTPFDEDYGKLSRLRRK